MVTRTELPAASTAPIISALAAPVPAVTLELCGFDAESGAFLLSVSSAAAIGVKRTRPVSYLRRDFADFQTWDRQLSRAIKQQQDQDHDQQHAQFERLPTRRVRKLMELSWLKNDASAGWRIELQKVVAASEKWINDAFQLLPADQQQVFLDHQRYQQYKQERADARADAQHAKNLQQYFTSQPLVDLTLERVASFLKTTTSAGELTFASDQILWLEPSCGDGRFVASLLDAGARRVIGIELDDVLCGEACAAVHEYPQERVAILQEDFLASQRSTSGAGVGTLQQVVAIGNPPFGDKANAAPSVDLIQRFFQHAAREWNAELIAFIVPERCARPAYTELTLATLHAATLSCAPMTPASSSVEWQLVASEPLDGYYFEFRNTKRIKQPSALLLYHRSSNRASEQQ